MVLFWLMVLEKGPVVLKARGIGLAHGIKEEGPVVLKKDKRIYKEKKFIVQIVRVGARCLSLNEYFSLK